MTIEPAPTPRGFLVHVGNIGNKPEPEHDLSVVWSTAPARSAAVFTRSRFVGASVEVSRAHARAGRLRGVVTISKNANVATGSQGERDAHELVRLAAGFTGVPEDELAVASTGVIGRHYGMEPIREHFAWAAAPAGDADDVDVFTSAARAIMTTDTRPKVAQVRVGDGSMVAIAKGAGMIAPNMATLLAYVFTDVASRDAGSLQARFAGVVNETLNCLVIDGDTSTSDTALLVCNGLAGTVADDDLDAALRAVLGDLTIQLAADGEGAEKLIVVRVAGASTFEQARDVARLIAGSPLVKTAVHGADPNWGRIAMAIGKAEQHEDIDQARVRIAIAGVPAYPPSEIAPEMLDALRAALHSAEVQIDVDLGIGSADATVYGCDLTREYVAINADYTT